MTMTRIHDPLDTQRSTRPDAPALRDHDGRTFTYGELSAAVDVLAAELKAQLAAAPKLSGQS